MKIKGSLISLSAKALAESFGTDMIRHTAAMVIQNYDLHDRLGFPHNIPIPARDAAQQVIENARASILREIEATDARMAVKRDQARESAEKRIPEAGRRIFERIVRDGDC